MAVQVMEDSKELDFKASVSLDKRINRGSDGTAATIATIATIESDWESHLLDPIPSLSPWSLYLAFRNAKILTVEPVVFLYMFGVYLSFPLFQQYYLNRYALNVLKNTSYPYANEIRCIDKDDVTRYTGDNTTYGDYVENNATLLFIYNSLAGQVLAIISTMVMGPVSDHYGRRPVIVMVALGASLQGLLNLVIIDFDLNLYFFVATGFISGVFGGFAAILMACFSYISDITSGKWRTLRIGITESMLFLAGLLSQGLGELWFQKLNCNIMPPLYLYIACNVAIIVYTLLLLPESLNSNERRRKNAGKPRGVKSLLRGAAIFFCQVKEYSVWKIWVAIVPVVIITVIMGAETSLGVFYFSSQKWKPALIGAYQATAMGSHMVGLMVLLPILVALKFPDPLITLIGVLFNCAMNLFLGLSTQVYEVFIGRSLGMLGGRERGNGISHIMLWPSGLISSIVLLVVVCLPCSWCGSRCRRHYGLPSKRLHV